MRNFSNNHLSTLGISLMLNLIFISHNTYALSCLPEEKIFNSGKTFFPPIGSRTKSLIEGKTIKSNLLYFI